MPRATVDITPHTYPLKTLPDGEVTLKRMGYGDWLTRQEMAMQMSVSGDNKDNAKMDLSMGAKEVAMFEYAHCLVSHNLEHEDGSPMVFPRDMGLLDPKIGQEIGELIDALHQLDEGNSDSGSSQ